MAAEESRKGKSWIAFATVGAAGVAILAAAIIARSPSPTEPPQAPAPKPSPVNLRRISSEGSLTRPSPEEDFLSAASKAVPREPMVLDTRDMESEFRRIFGALRDLFRKLRLLADAFKKTDPARYAAEMEANKEELARLMHAAKALLGDSEVALQELFRTIREEGDPVVKERLAFLLRQGNPGKVGPLAARLAESADPGDRKAAIGILPELRTVESVNALIQRAAGDPVMDLRQRAIVGLGKSLAGPSPSYPKYGPAALDALRQYVRPENETALRAAAYDAFSYPPRLAPEEQQLILKGFREERDPVVRQSAENAYRHMAARQKAEADRANPKNKVVPR